MTSITAAKRTTGKKGVHMSDCDDWDDWPEMDEEEKRLGFVHPDWPSDVLVPARYLCPEGEDWAYFGY